MRNLTLLKVASFALISLTGCVGEVGSSVSPTSGEGSSPGTQSGSSGSSGTQSGSGGSSGTQSGNSGSSGTQSGGSGSSGSPTGVGGKGGTGVAPAGGAASDLPCDVGAMLSRTCTTCHGLPPAPGVPMALVTYANLAGPSRSDPTKTNAVVAVARMMNANAPMPPVGSPAPTNAEIASIQAWIAAGYPTTGCSTVITPPPSPDGGTDSGPPPGPDPFAVAPICTGKTTWTHGTSGSGSMEPGMACINCHSKGQGPTFAIAGTLFPTAHEPDLCNGDNGSTDGARVVITGANGASITLTPNAAGNFYYQGTLAKPFQAKVTFMGRERPMVAAQTSGDCNSCHTQTGAMSAPGRIILP